MVSMAVSGVLISSISADFFVEFRFFYIGEQSVHSRAGAFGAWAFIGITVARCVVMVFKQRVVGTSALLPQSDRVYSRDDHR